MDGITIYLQKLNPVLLKGFYFMIGLSSSHSHLSLGDIILQAQEATGFFEFDLPIMLISRDPKTKPADANPIAKAKVTFA